MFWRSVTPVRLFPTAEEVAKLVDECAIDADAVFAELDAMEGLGPRAPRLTATASVVCGTSLAGRRGRARCCGPTCRQRLRRQRALSTGTSS